MDYLTTRLLLDDKTLRELILRTPSILRLSMEDNIEPKLNYLKNPLLLNDKALQKLVLGTTVLHYNIVDNIEPKLNWLQERLELSDTALSKMVQRMPAILLSLWIQQLLTSLPDR